MSININYKYMKLNTFRILKEKKSGEGAKYTCLIISVNWPIKGRNPDPWIRHYYFLYVQCNIANWLFEWYPIRRRIDLLETMRIRKTIMFFVYIWYNHEFWYCVFADYTIILLWKIAGILYHLLIIVHDFTTFFFSRCFLSLHARRQV